MGCLPRPGCLRGWGLAGLRLWRWCLLIIWYIHAQRSSLSLWCDTTIQLILRFPVISTSHFLAVNNIITIKRPSPTPVDPASLYVFHIHVFLKYQSVILLSSPVSSQLCKMPKLERGSHLQVWWKKPPMQITFLATHSTEQFTYPCDQKSNFDRVFRGTDWDGETILIGFTISVFNLVHITSGAFAWHLLLHGYLLHGLSFGCMLSTHGLYARSIHPNG